jgi:uncharacterized membrane protein YqhA
VKSLEALIEQLIMSARWLLVVFYGGLGLALIIYAVSFVVKFVEVAGGVLVLDEDEMILAMSPCSD